MQDINTLVTFSSRTGSTERLALAAALGAVQARANIRLRWLRENVDDQTVDRVSGWRENRDRMAKEYIAPREVDFLWADVLVIGIPARDGVSSPELKTYLDGLKALQSAGKLSGKVGTAFTAESTGTGRGDSALVSLCSVLAGLDLILVPPDPAATGNAVESARLHGRRLTEVARDLKQADAGLSRGSPSAPSLRS
jgi:NAD(P)H dehydrogenase (quinone)